MKELPRPCLASTGGCRHTAKRLQQLLLIEQAHEGKSHAKCATTLLPTDMWQQCCNTRLVTRTAKFLLANAANIWECGQMTHRQACAHSEGSATPCCCPEQTLANTPLYAWSYL